jgi:ribosomal protein L21E
VTADTLELVELFQNVARRVGSVLQRPVVTYANGEVVVITFDPAEPSLQR